MLTSALDRMSLFLGHIDGDGWQGLLLGTSKEITDMTTDKQDPRAAFEAWAKSCHLDCDTKVNDAWECPRYLPHIESMWFGWQASREQALTEAANICETQIDPTRSAATSGFAYWHAKAIKELLK